MADEIYNRATRASIGNVAGKSLASYEVDREQCINTDAFRAHQPSKIVGKKATLATAICIYAAMLSGRNGPIYRMMAWVTELQEAPETITRSLLYITVALLAALLAWYQLRRSRMEKMIAKIPGPPTWPIIGNAHLFLGLDMQGLCNKQLELMDKYGSIIRFWLGPYLWVNLKDPRHLEAILTSESATNKDPTYQFFKDQANGIFIASGEEWKKLRKMVNPTFNQKLLEQFVEGFNEHSKVLVNVLEKRIDGPKFDIHDHVARCTLDILCGTQMGVTSYEQVDNTSDFAKNLLKSTEITKQRFFKLYLQPDTFFHMTNLSKENKSYIKHLHKFVKGIITQRKLAKTKEVDTGDQLIIGDKKRAIFLDAALEHFKHLPEDEMVIKITDMFIAGSDTTAVGISYAFLLMGVYKDIQEKVYQEVIDVLGDNDEDITHLDLPKLPYLEMVLKEVLRLYTIPAIVRKLDKDQFIGDMTLPAGTSVQLCFYGVHRDPRFWSHPVEFYPDHFLPENIAKRPKFSYVPFGMGPRNCPGHAFAMFSMKTVVATVIRKYKFHSDIDIKNMQYNNIFMLEPKDGYPVQVTRR